MSPWKRLTRPSAQVIYCGTRSLSGGAIVEGGPLAKSQTCSWLLAAGLVLAIASVACGGGSSKSKATPTDTVPTEVPQPTAVPTPVVTGSHVNGTVGIGYEADIPSGWHLRPNVVTAPNFKVDGFFKTNPDPAKPDAPQISIAVGCEPPDSPPDALDVVLDKKVKALTQLRREDIKSESHAAVDGHPASQVDYIFRLRQGTPVPDQPPTAKNLALSRREIVFISDACIWSVALSVPNGPLGEDAGVLEQFLTTLKVRS